MLASFGCSEAQAGDKSRPEFGFSQEDGNMIEIKPCAAIYARVSTDKQSKFFDCRPSTQVPRIRCGARPVCST